MKRTYWQDRWKEGKPSFHQSEVAPFLLEYAGRVWGSGDFGRIFVPLCGKSLDMVFLAERATEIVGVEYVEPAVIDFFDERGLAPEIEADPETRYLAGRYTLYVADFFSLAAEQLGPLDGVFDRAALVALDRETRVRYAGHLGSLLTKGTRVLLVTFDYDQSKMDGPPFAVSRTEVEHLFRDGFEVTHLQTRDCLDERFRTRGLTAMSESAFELKRR